MLITDFSRRAGVSARALRHYEAKGLLEPERTSAGYRVYREGDLATVARIRLMIDAGLSTSVIATYLDCVRVGEGTHHLQMCPTLRAELDKVADRLDRDSAQLAETRRALCALG